MAPSLQLLCSLWDKTSEEERHSVSAMVSLVTFLRGVIQALVQSPEFVKTVHQLLLFLHLPPLSLFLSPLFLSLSRALCFSLCVSQLSLQQSKQIILKDFTKIQLEVVNKWDLRIQINKKSVAFAQIKELREKEIMKQSILYSLKILRSNFSKWGERLDTEIPNTFMKKIKEYTNERKGSLRSKIKRMIIYTKICIQLRVDSVQSLPKF